MKHKLVLATFVIFFLCCAVTNILAQWVRTNGPFGGVISCLAVSRSNIFASSEYGDIYLSTNNGVNWDAITNLGARVKALAVSDTNLFAATVNKGIFLSTNNGISWV